MLNNLFSNQIVLGFVQVAIAFVLALLVVLIANRRGIHIEKEVLVSLLRGIVQITVVGSLLLALLKSPTWAGILILLGMFLAAARTAARRAKGVNGAFRASFYGIAIASGVVIGVMSALGVIEYKLLSLVPVGSMIISAAMNSNALALNRFKAEIGSHIGLIETALSLGASPQETVKPYLQASVHASLIPRIDSLRTLGIVWIPGLMTGMVIAGSDPFYAAIYQFVVMAMIFATSGLSAMITMAFIQKEIFSPAEQLLLVTEGKGEGNGKNNGGGMKRNR
ncbi:ABC transporter permease [Pelolinea submarina]|uniref:Putative ABC transport system permease protein n=1 Tax=Pelolinea submarina TaxID=913107 RepID=A0A347ZUT4_9CHLR|nr:iron export ABC transporter permease subunit FetB [Pelolinea submarina]REG10350.1 putative ABC transport system permease protein [Pelolinea submarina]BBB49065.1 ABC transport system permease protein [Pelolinea submarina]